MWPVLHAPVQTGVRGCQLVWIRVCRGCGWRPIRLYQGVDQHLRRFTTRCKQPGRLCQLYPGPAYLTAAHLIAYATEDDPFTQPQVDTARAVLEKGGIKTASYQVYPAETTDYTPIADKIIASGAQIASVGNLLNYVSAFIHRIKQQQHNPQALIATAGPDQGSAFLNVIGGTKPAEGIMVPNGGCFRAAPTPGNAQRVPHHA